MTAQTGHRAILLHENVDSILERTAQGTMHFVTTFAKAHWIFDERYQGNLVVGLKARVAMFQQMDEWD